MGADHMNEINLIPGADGNSEGAFCRDLMDQAGIDSVQLMAALNKRLAPFASLLRDGAGVAVVISGENASIIGLDIATSPPLP